MGGAIEGVHKLAECHRGFAYAVEGVAEAGKNAAKGVFGSVSLVEKDPFPPGHLADVEMAVGVLAAGIFPENNRVSTSRDAGSTGCIAAPGQLQGETDKDIIDVQATDRAGCGHQKAVNPQVFFHLYAVGLACRYLLTHGRRAGAPGANWERISG